MRKEDVQTKLDIIPENLEKLEILSVKSFQEFTSDFRNIDSALHRLQTSIQALVDIGGYIIASLGLRTPGTSGEVIDILVEYGLLKTEQRDRGSLSQSSGSSLYQSGWRNLHRPSGHFRECF